MDMRVLAAADVFDALSAARPYRRALPINEVFEILDKLTCHHLDPDCVAALHHLYSDGVPRLPLAA
jgi:HD-GYP domain-containing protein (c-di-GMP phosphodiesterase class II)